MTAFTLTAEIRNDACRVLIVEDNVDLARYLAISLEQHEHEVQTARNGTEGLTVASSYHPHVVLLDIGLPGVDGLYVARQLRKSFEGLLLIAVTGKTSPADVQRSREAGCDHHLTKPVDVETVVGLLNDWKAQGGCH